MKRWNSNVAGSAPQGANLRERRGLAAAPSHPLQTALDALATTAQRCRKGDTWQRTALHLHELDALATATDLHKYQLQQLSADELHSAVTKVTAAAPSASDRVIQVSNTDLAAVAA